MGIRRLRSLESLAPLEVSRDERLGALAALQRESARLAGAQVRAIVDLAGATTRGEVVALSRTASGRTVRVRIPDIAREEIALELRLTPSQAAARLAVARMLWNALPRTLAALEAGDVTYEHAVVMAEQARRFEGALLLTEQHPVRDSPDDAHTRAEALRKCHELEDLVLPTALRSTVERTRTRARGAVIRIDAAGAEERQGRMATGFDVRFREADDGLALMEAWLPAVDAARLQCALESRAAQVHTDDDATRGQRRARALVEALCHRTIAAADSTAARNSGTASAAATSAGATEIQVVIDLASLVGSANSPAAVSCTGGIQHLVTAETIRAMLRDPALPVTMRRLLTDPQTGALVDRGRRRYQVTDSLRDYIVDRDATCRFPGCTRRASRCQIDHARPWEDGGPTDRANLGALCVRHHQLKTHAGWQILESRVDGACTWRSPAAHIYEVPPTPILPAAQDPDPPPF
jgi:hypothetical protein